MLDPNSGGLRLLVAAVSAGVAGGISSSIQKSEKINIGAMVIGAVVGYALAPSVLRDGLGLGSLRPRKLPSGPKGG